jgi:hypothetical protein
VPGTGHGFNRQAARSAPPALLANWLARRRRRRAAAP